MQQQTQTQLALKNASALEQDLKYKVQQDFLNIIGMAQDVQETINFFKNDKTNQNIVIQLNRLIVQYNLSNLIHFDINQTANQENLFHFLMQEKLKMNGFLETYINDFDPQIIEYLQKYQKNSLAKNPIIVSENLKPTEVQAEFNSKVVQKVMNGIAENDRVVQNIKNGKKIDELTDEDVQQCLKDRKENANKQLEKNYGENNNKNEIINNNNKNINQGENNNNNNGKGWLKNMCSYCQLI